MTAIVHFGDGVTRFPHVVISGDGLARAAKWIGRPIPGTLWERVADRATIEPRRDYPLEVGERGPRFDLYRESPLASGIIRAGERVR